MFSYILETIASYVTAFISVSGYIGVFVCMIIESACIPLPSEIIMPFSGYIVFLGKFDIWIVTFVGSLGNLVGSLIAYAAGFYGGRPFIEKYGKYVLMSKHDIDVADKWFSKYGDITIFVSRMMPVIRTFISLPAGIARMNIIKFSVYSFIGSLPWCFLLTFIGMKLGENWKSIEVYFHQFDIFIGIIIILGIVYWIKMHFCNKQA